MSSAEFILPSSAESKGGKLISNVSLVSPFILNLSTEELRGVEVVNNTPILTDIMTLNNNRLPLKSLKSELKNLNYIQRMRQLNSYTGGAGLTLSSISFVLVLITLVIIFCFCRVSKAQDKDNSNNSTPLAERPKSTFGFQLNNIWPVKSNDNVTDNQSTPLTQDTQIEQLGQTTSREEITQHLISAPTIRPRTNTVPCVNVHSTDRHTKTCSEQYGEPTPLT